jgi:hypothetical protein
MSRCCLQKINSIIRTGKTREGIRCVHGNEDTQKRQTISCQWSKLKTTILGAVRMREQSNQEMSMRDAREGIFFLCGLSRATKLAH